MTSFIFFTFLVLRLRGVFFVLLFTRFNRFFRFIRIFIFWRNFKTSFILWFFDVHAALSSHRIRFHYFYFALYLYCFSAFKIASPLAPIYFTFCCFCFGFLFFGIAIRLFFSLFALSIGHSSALSSSLCSYSLGFSNDSCIFLFFKSCCCCFAILAL